MVGSGPWQVGREEARLDGRIQACAGDSVCLSWRCRVPGVSPGKRHGEAPWWPASVEGVGKRRRIPSPPPHESCKGPSQHPGRGGSLSSFAGQLRLKVKS